MERKWEGQTLLSPDGRVKMRVALDDAGQPRYRVDYDGLPMISWSALGLELAGGPAWEPLAVVEVARHSWDDTWDPPYGERALVRDHGNGLTVTWQEQGGNGRRLTLNAHAYDEGVAFRYQLPAQSSLDEFVIAAESTTFCFPMGTMGYEEHGTEGAYQLSAVADIQPGCERPLTLVYPHGRYGCLLEAQMVDYSRMLLSPVGEGQPGLRADLDGPVTGQIPYHTPWRALIVGERPGDLLERNDLVRSLNPPCAIRDTSWIKPGKVIREVTLSTAGGIACVDFAVDHDLQYIEYDAGWYGHEYDDNADATTVTPDADRTDKVPGWDGLDLPDVIEYARNAGVGVLLYVNRRALERQLDELLPLFVEWGVAGIKFGFVQVGPQAWTQWLHQAVRKCADHRLLVDIHDSYRPTGFSRTYPNLLTQEGVRGNEHMPTPRHNCTLPFCRFPAGAADVTICYYSDRIQPTHAHQLAMAVIIYSPLQFLFWYDQPSDYQGEPEIAFWESVPTTWDETRVLAGEIGEYVVIARRSGEEWFIGAITNEQPRAMSWRLDMLGRGAYVAEMYGDALSNGTRTGVGVASYRVTNDTIWRCEMATGGGQAMRLRPAGPGDWDAKAYAS